MAGLIPQEHVTDVDAHLQSNMLFMKVDSINQHLIKMILGPSFQHCRSIYLLSRSEALIDMVQNFSSYYMLSSRQSST